MDEIYATIAKESRSKGSQKRPDHDGKRACLYGGGQLGGQQGACLLYTSVRKAQRGEQRGNIARDARQNAGLRVNGQR